MTDRDHFVVVIDDEGRRNGIFPDMLRALVDQGIVWREGDRWRTHNSDFFAQCPSAAVCDLCTQRPVRWEIDVADFKMPISESIGGWVACEECGALVAAGNQRGLLERCLRQREAESGPLGVVRIAFVQEVQELFWQHFRSIKRL